MTLICAFDGMNEDSIREVAAAQGWTVVSVDRYVSELEAMPLADRISRDVPGVFVDGFPVYLDRVRKLAFVDRHAQA